MPPNQESVRLVFENDDYELVPTLEARGYRTVPILFVNGKRVPRKVAALARPNQTLLSFLRDEMLLTGSKLGCAEGGCGACTVLLSKVDRDGTLQHNSVNACLMPILAADGCHITTIEGVGTVKGDNLHPIQKAMVDMHGSQCGFCTPGIIVAIYGLFANNPSTEYLEEHLDGNLCRCTGYRPIWDAAKSLCGDAVTTGPCGTPCRECPERDDCTMDCNTEDKAAEEQEKTKQTTTTEPAKGLCCSSSADKTKAYAELAQDKEWLEQPNKMFPSELADEKSAVRVVLEKPLVVVGESEHHKAGTWFKPTTLEEMLKLIQQFGGIGQGGCKIVVGNTEVGIEARFKHAVYPRLIAPADTIESLFGFAATETAFKIGACTPLSTIQKECHALTGGDDARYQRTAQPMHDMLRWFASTQIRNVACLGGNLVTASPISDMNPMLAAMGATLVLSSMDDGGKVARRTVPVKDFFVSYRTVDLAPTEVVEYVDVPVVKDRFEYVQPFKQARRREDDISIVTSGMKMSLEVVDSKWIVKDITIAFGGMAAKTILATKTMAAIQGQEFHAETFDNARAVLMKELKLPMGVPGGQPVYRLALAASFLYKFFVLATESLKADVGSDTDKFPAVPIVTDQEQSASYSFVGAKKPSITGTQKFPEPKVTSGLEDEVYPLNKPPAPDTTKPTAVGKPATHMSGPLHCTGEAIYTDDIPQPPRTAQASLVLSKQCGCIMESIDATKALEVPGVIGVYTAEDVKALGGDNTIGPVVHDEFVFLPVGEKVKTVGQVLGLVIAETLETAEEAARLVDIKYGPVEDKVVVTIADAIAANSFFEMTRHNLACGDMKAVDGLSVADSPSSSLSKPSHKPGDKVVVEGSFSVGGQEHFYLEVHCALVVPSESDTNLTIYCSTQATNKTQMACAAVTAIPSSKVVVRMKRMGGGFGGKETRSVFAAAAAAVAAKKSGRPVRITLPRDVDMSITGGRHGFVAKYKASAIINDDGSATIDSADITMYSNGGWAMDLSGPVMDRALFHIDSCYKWKNLRVEGVVCKTAHPNHTAYRGFGAPQGIVIAEHIVDHLATVCGIRVEKMRRDNMYDTSDVTHFGMQLDQEHTGAWNVPSMWDRLMGEVEFDKRVAAIKDFNSKNKWLKRGIAFVPTKFGIAFTAKFMNQGGALVHVYTDGTVLISHGGTEMGQGLHTKVCQIAAQAFGIPLSDVYVNDSSTDKVANSIPTAASMSTDSYGMATLDACRQILNRLQPLRDELGPDATLKELAMKAHFSRIDLTAHGFFTVDDKRCGFDWTKERPDDWDDSLPENAWKGHPFNYFTQGVACAEVEIDASTGNHRTIRADVVVDLGSSISPMIDIGQIEGAFTQGMGWSTMEELVYGDDDHPWVRPRGRLFTAGPGTYKIPAFNDVPEIFNVSLLENVTNPFAVHSSKAVGEPPFFLGSIVFFAIKDAIKAAREENGLTGYFEMRMPATSERVRMMCGDEIMQDATVATMMDGADETSGSMDEEAKKELCASYQPFGSY